VADDRDPRGRPPAPASSIASNRPTDTLSFDWWQLRRGVPTASSFDRILTPAKGQPSAQQEDYIAELVAERAEFTAPYVVPSGGFVSGEMEEGLRREPEARSWYAMQTDGAVRRVGFVLSACGRWGCSPDALVGEDGGLELKNPTAKVHVKYLLKGGLPAEYRCQVHGCLIVTGRAWFDFVSYHPGFAPLIVRSRARRVHREAAGRVGGVSTRSTGRPSGSRPCSRPVPVRTGVSA
jgi:hypothetical protein